MPQQWDKQEIKGPVQKKKTPPRTTGGGVDPKRILLHETSRERPATQLNLQIDTVIRLLLVTSYVT